MEEVQDLYSGVAELLRQAGDGDGRAWDAIVERFAPMVWAVARGLGLSAADAADVSQTTWMRLVQHLDRIEQPERVGGWLATTARRESLRVRRVAGRQIPTIDDEVVVLADSPFTPPDLDLLRAERDFELWAVFAELPARCQYILRSLMGDATMSYEDLSVLLDMPVGSIGPTRARCLERLRRMAASLGPAAATSEA
jgi:RNA polymerase sigma factor (sigma-70 family)